MTDTFNITSWLDTLTHKLLHNRAGLVPLRADDIQAGSFGASVGYGQFIFDSHGGGPDNVLIRGTNGTLRLDGRDTSANWTALYRNGGFFRIWDSGAATDVFYIDGNGVATHGPGHVAAIVGPDVNYGVNTYASFRASSTAATNYAVLQSSSDSFFNAATTGHLRIANADKFTWDTNGLYANIELFMNSNTIDLRGWGDNFHLVRYGGTADGVELTGNANAAGFYSANQGAWIGFIGGASGGFLVQNGNWHRNVDVGTGWYNNGQGVGLMGDNHFGSTGSVSTQNDETQILARKISQAGWATAGLESYGNSSTMVPYMTLHSQNCCTSSWRKDSGQSYMVVINSGGGCDWVYAANHPVCSEEARKRNIAVISDYGLKTLRTLKTKRFQYVPSTEDEIWAWEDWKHRRANGQWKYPPNEHMNWDVWHIGYMAEEMANLVPEVVGYYADGKPKGIDYGNLIVVVIEAVNELADRIEDLEAKVMMLSAA